LKVRLLGFTSARSFLSAGMAEQRHGIRVEESLATGCAHVRRDAGHAAAGREDDGNPAAADLS